MSPMSPISPIGLIGPIHAPCDSHHQQRPHYQVTCRHAGHGLCRRAEILQARGVELELPEGVEAGIGHEGQGKGDGHDGIVDPEHRAGHPYPYRHGRDEEGHDEEVECRRQVERQSVPRHSQIIARRDAMPRPVAEHEHPLSHHKQQHRQQIESKQKGDSPPQDSPPTPPCEGGEYMVLHVSYNSFLHHHISLISLPTPLPHREGPGESLFFISSACHAAACSIRPWPAARRGCHALRSALRA